MRNYLHIHTYTEKAGIKKEQRGLETDFRIDVGNRKVKLLGEDTYGI